jgi:hypothetical protein
VSGPTGGGLISSSRRHVVSSTVAEPKAAATAAERIMRGIGRPPRAATTLRRGCTTNSSSPTGPAPGLLCPVSVDGPSLAEGRVAGCSAHWQVVISGAVIP